MAPPPDLPNPSPEPEETLETNTTQPAETESLPVVLETRLELTAQVDPEPCEGLSVILEPEATPEKRPDIAPDPLPAVQTEPDAPDDGSEVESPSQNSYPDTRVTRNTSRKPVDYPFTPQRDQTAQTARMICGSPQTASAPS